MSKQIILKARYGLTHTLDMIDENTYKATDFSRFSYEKQDENGKYIGIEYIDFDGGPFLAIGSKIPGLEGKTIKSFNLIETEINNMSCIEIILEDEQRIREINH